MKIHIAAAKVGAAGILVLLGAPRPSDALAILETSLFLCASETTVLNPCAGSAILASGPNTASTSRLFPDATTISTVSGSASPDFGVLGATSTSTFDISPAGYVFGQAFAHSFDTLTISDPALTGQLGTVSVSYALDGSVSTTGDGLGYSSACVRFRPTTSGTFTVNQRFYTGSVAGSFSGGTFTFVFGQPFNLDLGLLAVSGANNIAVPPTSTTQCSGLSAAAGAGTNLLGTASADFSATMILSGLTVLDPSGNDISTRVSYASESGTAYSSTGVLTPVPEPSTLMLLATGVGAALRRRRRSTYQSQH